MIVMGYHKGFSRSERMKVIQHFLPREIGTLFIYYLWLVVRFWKELQVNVLGREELSPSVWATEDMLANEGGGDDSDSDGYGSAASDTGDVQHSQRKRRVTTKSSGTKDAWQLGSGTHWTSPRMSRILKRNSLVGCQEGFTLSSWQHLSAAIARRYFRTSITGQSSFVDQIDVGYGSESDGEDTEDSSPWDTQAGHESLTAGLVYGRLIMEGSFETNERRSTSGTSARSGTDCWGSHRPWGRSVASYGRAASGKARPCTTKPCARRSWRVVMGTGQGKSLCFMFPAASCAGGITLVVVPLVWLLGDMMVRCEKLGIACAEWRTDRAPGNVSIVFVTPESALTKRFLDYVEALRVTARLDKVVIDECHTILEGTPAFRPKLRELGRLTLIGVKMVYLTATLPPRREVELFELTNSRPEDVEMIRMRTTRKNIAYSVVRVRPGQGQDASEVMTAAVLATVKRKLDEHPWPAKVIVYTRRVEATAHLAERLHCDAYHREVDTRDGKAERLRAWRQGIRRDQTGEGRVIVATNALGLGIDVPDIRVAIHVDRPTTMEDYAQQSGRAGRDGQRSEAIVLRMDMGTQQWENRVLVRDGGTAEDYVSGQTCRRVVLDSVMDGRMDRSSCEAGEEPCDVCQGDCDGADGGAEEDEEECQLRQREVMVQVLRGRAMDRAAEAQLEFARFRGRLERQLAMGCVFCASGNTVELPHSVAACPGAASMDRPRAQAYWTMVRITRFMRRAGVIERFGCCQGCLVPQEMCNGWEENNEEGGWTRRVGVDCQYESVLTSIVSCVGTALGDWSERLYHKLGFESTSPVSGKEDKELWTWLGKRSRWVSMDVSNICRVCYFMMAEGEDGAEFAEACIDEIGTMEV